uniref:Uncharacterized protein n=1 Tax=Anguilla anguilla TaxID=7936 RepID=A0A0E9Q1M3_ANGAN
MILILKESKTQALLTRHKEVCSS